MPTVLVRFLVIVLVVCAGSVVHADDDDQDRARQALERGEIRPLNEVLDVAHKHAPGEVVKVKLEHEQGAWVYEFKILDVTGKRRKIEIDANSLRILETD